MALTMQPDAWIADWNDIIRNIIFKDDDLKELMMLPKNIKLITFIDRYFVRAGTSSVVLKDEDVRIVYSATSVGTLGETVSSNIISFDIYVKNEHLHNCCDDGMVFRTQMIALRLRQLLMKQRYNGVYRFFDPNEGDMNTSTIGYSRYNLTLSFIKLY